MNEPREIFVDLRPFGQNIAAYYVCKGNEEAISHCLQCINIHSDNKAYVYWYNMVIINCMGNEIIRRHCE